MSFLPLFEKQRRQHRGGHQVRRRGRFRRIQSEAGFQQRDQGAGHGHTYHGNPFQTRERPALSGDNPEAMAKPDFTVILNEVKDLKSLKIGDSSLCSE
jgi:hypothetical protein